MHEDDLRLSLGELQELSLNALLASKTDQANARSVSDSITAAEADGIPSHGLLRVPVYCEDARSGVVNGFAVPTLEERTSAILIVDAHGGFAHPAIDVGIERLLPMVRREGIGVLAVANSYIAGVMGMHVERIATQGLVALGFSNAPASIAPWHGRKPVFGTNPIAFAAPRANGFPIVVDQAASVVARGEVMLHAEHGHAIPMDWGLDRDGRPTTDPNSVLDGGSMAPVGGHKGVGLALIAEVFAGAVTGAHLSFEGESLRSGDRKRASLGQLFLAIDPDRVSGGVFETRIEALCEEICRQSGARLPGERRFAARVKAEREGVVVDRGLYEKVLQFISAQDHA